MTPKIVYLMTDEEEDQEYDDILEAEAFDDLLDDAFGDFDDDESEDE